MRSSPLIFAFLSMTLVGCIAGGETDADQQSSRASLEERKTVSTWIPYWDQENALASYDMYEETIDIVSLFWYRIDAKGHLTTYEVVEEDKALVERLQASGATVVALIANMPDYFENAPDWDAERVDHVIASADARSAHINKILALVDRMGYDGIDIDYENLQERQKNDFSQFIKELGTALHMRGKILGVALHPKTTEGDPRESNGSQAQDWVALAQYADRLNLMAFGEHYSESKPGSVASSPWITRILQHAKRLGVPTDKIVVELPFYAQRWQQVPDGYTGVSEELTSRSAQQLMESQNADAQWNTKAQSTSYSFVDENIFVVWTEDEKSLRSKLSLVDEYKILHIGFWRLGGETEEMMGVLKTWK